MSMAMGWPIFSSAHMAPIRSKMTLERHISSSAVPIVFPASFELAALDGSNGFRMNGEADGDYTGRAVNAAGDINGDGFDDIILSSTDAESGGNPFAGRSYVVFGKATFDATVELATLNGENGFKILGADGDDYSGQSVSGAGDIDGDGFEDLLIGAPNASPAGRDYSGVTYLFFGKARGFDPRLNLATFDRNDSSSLSAPPPAITRGRRGRRRRRFQPRWFGRPR